jgi:hypothetical protein
LLPQGRHAEFSPISHTPYTPYALRTLHEYHRTLHVPNTPYTPNAPYTPNTLHAAYPLSPNTACTLHEGVHADDPPLLVLWEEEEVQDPGNTAGGGGGGRGRGGVAGEGFSGCEAASESQPRLDLQERGGGGRLRGESALCSKARRISVLMQILQILDLRMSRVSERQLQEDMLAKCHQAQLILPAGELRAPGTPLFWHLAQEYKNTYSHIHTHIHTPRAAGIWYRNMLVYI